MADFETKKRIVRILQEPSGEWRISGGMERELIGDSSNPGGGSRPVQSLMLGVADTASAVTSTEFLKAAAIRSALPLAGCGVGGGLGAVVGAYSTAGVGAVSGAVAGCNLGVRVVGAVVLADSIYGVTNTAIDAASSGARALQTSGAEQDEWARQFGRELAALGIVLATRRKSARATSSPKLRDTGLEYPLAANFNSKEVPFGSLEPGLKTALSSTPSSKTLSKVRLSLSQFPQKSKFRTEPQDIEAAIDLAEHNEITTGVREYLERVGGKKGAQALVPIIERLLGPHFFNLEPNQLQALQAIVLGFTPTELQYLSLNLRVRIKTGLTFRTQNGPLSGWDRAALERVDFSLNLPAPFLKEYDEPRRDRLVESLSTDPELQRIERKMRADPGRYNNEESRVRYLRRTVELACEVYEIPKPEMRFYEMDKVDNRKGVLGIAWRLDRTEASDRGAVGIAVRGENLDNARQLALPSLMETGLHEFRHILQSHLEKQTYEKLPYVSQIRDLLKVGKSNETALIPLTGFLFRYVIEEKTPENRNEHWYRYRRTFIERDAREFAADVMFQVRRAKGDMRTYRQLTAVRRGE